MPNVPDPTSLGPCWLLGTTLAVTAKLLLLVTVPPAVVTETTPFTAPGITIAASEVPVLDMTTACASPIVIAVGAERSVPTIVTSVPTGPVDGLKEEIAGVCAKTVEERKASKRITMPFSLYSFVIYFG